MSLPQPPQPAKLVVGVIMQERRRLVSAGEALCEKFGALDLVSPWYRFDATDYYEPEMGAPLFRRMLVFRKPIRQHALAAIKRVTNGIEQRYVEAGRRSINIDPGYLLRERFVLATGKNFSHRIYIGRGIYADLTLVFRQGDFRSLPWTYPDYADPTLRGFLVTARKKYILDLKRSAFE